MMKNFSDYVVYIDESGNHNLSSIDDKYPIFVLVFCVFHKKDYSEKIVPAIQQFKFRHFGHDCIVLHEHEIRKRQNAFSILNTQDIYNTFINNLSGVISNSDFILISCVVDKIKMKQNDKHERDIYHIALEQCLDSLYLLLEQKNQSNLCTHLVVESRDTKDNRELELAFLRYCKGNNHKKIQLPFEIIFADKKTNSIGLQIADLVAKPIGLNYIKPTQANRAFETLKTKFYCFDKKDNLEYNYQEYGLKIYPIDNSKLKKAKSLDECTEAITPTRNAQSEAV
jgi:hypothetical protein